MPSQPPVRRRGPPPGSPAPGAGPRRFVIEPVEPRLLYSADFAAAFSGGAAGVGGLFDERRLEAPALQAPPLQAAPRAEIALVDGRLPAADGRLAELQARRQAGQPLEVVTLQPGDDGIARATELLRGRADVGALHLVGRSADGALQLGRVTLDAPTLLARAGELAAWGQALAPGAQLLLPGSDGPAGSAGAALRAGLAALTGAEVAAAAPRALIVVAANLPDSAQLVAGLRASSPGDVEVLVLAADRDGLAQIGERLAQAGRPFDAVHLVSHAAPGRVDLGTGVGDRWLDEATLQARHEELARWSTGFAADGDLLLYGCDLAGSAAGERLLAGLAGALGVDVAASTDATGAAAQGADWALEYRLGEVAAGAPLAATAWTYTLATATLGVTANVFTDVVDGNTDSIDELLADPGADGGISLREAVLAANRNADGDVITLLAGTYSLGSELTVSNALQIAGAGAGQSVIDGGGDQRLITVTGGSLQLQALTLQGGAAGTGNGGALLISGNTSVTLDVVALVGNTAKFGGAIYSQGTLTATNVSFVGNVASTRGGALFVSQGGAALTNATLSGNVSSGNAGAIYANRPITLTHATVANNWAASGAGGIELGGSGQATLSNTILAGNTGGNASGTFVSSGFNLDTDGTAGLSVGTNLQFVDARLNPLSVAASGIHVHTLQDSSPAIDAGGGASTVDAVGVTRNAIPDIGASENRAASQAKLYWAEVGSNSIWRSNTDGTAQQRLVTGLNGARGVAVDLTNGFVYWSERFGNVIRRAKLDGSGITAVATGLHGPVGLALDAVAGRLYFADNGSSGFDHIERIDVTGSNRDDLLSLPTQPSDVALDLAGGHLYAVQRTNGELWRASISGDSPVLLFSGAGLTAVRELEIDVAGGMLYWTDGNEGTNAIYRGRVDGTGSVEKLIDGLSSPHGLALDLAKGRLYWNEWGTDKIGSANLDGTAPVWFGIQSDQHRDLDILVLPVVNQAPQGADKTLATAEDTGLTLKAADFGFFDADGQALASVVIATLPTAGSLTLNGAAVTVNQSVSAADIAANRLVFTPALNGSGTGYASFTFQVRDNGGTANGGIDLDPTPNTLSFNVTPVNDAPTGTSATLTILEDTPRTLAAADFGFTDVDGNAFDGIVIASVPGAGSLTLNGAAVTMNQSVSAADIAAGRLVFTPALNANGNGYASFSFKVRDNGGTANGGVDLDPTARTLTFNVTPVNDAPTIGAIPDLTLDEDTNHILHVPVTLADIDTPLVALELSATSSHGPLVSQFTYAGSGGNRELLIWLEGNGFGTSTITVTASDGSSSASTSFTLTVNPVNDRPETLGPATLATIDEDTASPAGATVATLFASSYSDAVDAGQSTDLAGVAIVHNAATAEQGQWQHSANGIDGWTAIPSSGLSDKAALVLPASHWLRFVPSANWSGTPGGLFVRLADGSQGAVAAGTAVDLTGAFGETGIWTDGWVLLGTAVTPVNDAPTAVVLDNTAVAENSAIGTLVGLLSVSDVDGPAPSFSIVGGAVPFSISGNRLEVSGPLDFENQSAWNLTIRADDGAGGTLDQVVTISVTDVNEGGGNAPPVAANYTQTLAEDGTLSGSVAGLVTDVDSSSFTYAIVGDTPAGLVFDTATGAYTYTTAANFHGALSFQYKANDGVSDSNVATVSINVTPVNDAPIIELPPVLQARTNSPLQLIREAGLRFTDVDATSFTVTLATTGGVPIRLVPDSLDDLISHSGNGTDTVTITGTKINVNRAVNGMILDIGASGPIDLTVAVSDNGGAGAGGPQTTTASSRIVVTPGAMPQVTTTAGPVTFTEDDPGLVVDPGLTVSDSDSAQLTQARVTIMLRFRAGDLLQATSLPGGITQSWDEDGKVLTLSGTTSVANYQAALRSVTFSNSSQNPSTATRTLAFVVDDGNGPSLAATRDVKVVAVNDAPTLALPIADQSATEDSAFAFTVPARTFADVDVGDTLVYTATQADGTALPSWLSFDAATRRFGGTPTNGDVGPVVLRVTATDSAGAQASGSFTLTVANANDAPTLALPIADQSATEDSAFAFTVPARTFADVDVGDTLVYTATQADGTALPSWLSFDAATRRFSGTPTNGDVGPVVLRVTATDSDGAQASGSFTLTVANANGAPTLAVPITDQSATEDSAFTFTVPANTFADVDAGDTLVYTATQADGTALPAWLSFDAATRRFSAAPTNGNVGPLVLRVTATDAAGAQASGSFTLTVANANDAPMLAAPIAAQTATEGSIFTFAVPSSTFADVDVGDTLVYTATKADGTALPAWLRFDAATMGFRGAPQRPDAGPLDVRVTATDRAGQSASGDFRIDVVALPFVPPAPTAPPAPAPAVVAPAPAPAPAPSASPVAVPPPAAMPAPAPSPAADPSSASLTSGGRSPSPAPATSAPTAAPAPAPAPASSASRAPASGAPGASESPAAAAPAGAKAQESSPDAPSGPAPAGDGAKAAAAAPGDSGADVAKVPGGAVAATAPGPAGGPAAPAGQAPAPVVSPGANPGAEAVAAVGRWVSGSGLGGSLAAPAPVQPSLSWAPIGQLGLERGAFDSALGLGSSSSGDSSASQRVDNSFRQLREDAQEEAVVEQGVVASSVVVSTGFSVGYVLWLARGGALLASLASAIPAWAMVDPMPVLSKQRPGGGRGPHAQGPDPDADNDGMGAPDDEVEDMFDAGSRDGAPSTPPPLATPPLPAAATQPAVEARS